MLWTPTSGFNWQVDNFGATYTDAGLGVNVPGHASANTKGANTNVLNGIAEDCYALAICFSGGSTSTTSRRQLTDLLIDPAAGVGNPGSSWSVAINNLYSSGPAFSAGGTGCWYYFPLFLRAGTAIGGAHQDGTAGALALRMSVRVYGKPTRSELLRVGTRVQTLGVNLGTTAGTSVTPGTSALGSYSASLGTLNFSAWWWQVGAGISNATLTGSSYFFDVAANATNKIICAQSIPYGMYGTVEQQYKGAMGCGQLPIREIGSGDTVYVRAACSGSPLSPITATVYALGS